MKSCLSSASSSFRVLPCQLRMIWLNLTLLCVLQTPRAQAEEIRNVLTASPVLHVGLGMRERTLLERGFGGALRHSQAVVGASDNDCFGESCWQALSQEYHADLVVSYCAATDGSIGLCDPRQHTQSVPDEPTLPIGPRNYRFAALIYSPLTRVVTTASAGCNTCDIAEAVARLQGLTETLIRTASRPDAVGTLTLRGVPGAALVFVDGVLRLQGTGGPLSLTLRAEQNHSLAIYVPGHTPFHQAGVKVSAGQAAEIGVPALPESPLRDTEQPEAPPSPEQGYYYRRSPSAWRWGIPIGLLGVGGLMLGFGGRAMALDGTCLSSQPGCPAVYGTHDLGLGLAVAGGALIAGGVLGLALGVQKVYVRVPPRSSTE